MSEIDFLPLGLTSEQIAALEEAFCEAQSAPKSRPFWGRRGR